MAPAMGLLAVLCARVPWVGTVTCAIQKRTSVLAIRAQMEVLVPTVTTPTLVHVTPVTRGTTAERLWIRARQILAKTVGHAALGMMVLQIAHVQQATLATCVRLTEMIANQPRARTAVNAQTG